MIGYFFDFAYSLIAIVSFCAGVTGWSTWVYFPFHKPYERLCVISLRIYTINDD